MELRRPVEPGKPAAQAVARGLAAQMSAAQRLVEPVQAARARAAEQAPAPESQVAAVVVEAGAAAVVEPRRTEGQTPARQNDH